MELLGIGVKMQGSTSSNYPNSYFTRDLKEIFSGCVWPQMSEDKMVKGVYSSKGFFSPLSGGLYIGYGREALKQIMLKQEAIFKDQIYELHRLYQRQREFVTEMKRMESHRNDICNGTSHSSQTSKLCAQDANDFPLYRQSLVSVGEKGLLSTQGKSVATSPDIVPNAIGPSNPCLTESMSMVSEKQGPNLEFLTDKEHLNKRDELSLVKKLSEVPEMSSYHLKRVPENVHISDGETFLPSYDLNASLYRGLSTIDSSLGKTKCLIDLNDPLNIEEESASRADDLEDHSFHREIVFPDPYGKTNSKFLAFSEKDIHVRESGLSNHRPFKSNDICEGSKPYQPVSDKDIAYSSPSSTTTLKKYAQDERLESFDLVTESSKTVMQSCMLNEEEYFNVKNLRSSMVSDGVSLIEGCFCNSSKSESVRPESHPSLKVSSNWLEGQFDLNVCMNDEFLPTQSCSTVIELEVPVSPRKKIHSTPIREFDDDNQVGTYLLNLVEDDGKSEDDIGIAAEALVSISLSVAQDCPENTACRSTQASFESLCWFAGIVSSMGGDPEKVEVELKSQDAKDSGELLPKCMDDFEIMTLKLTETEVEGYSSTMSGQQVQAPMSFCQLGKGRVRRSKRKSFQTEVLPSLATLSRYEVNEDIQTIGGLMEASCSNSIASVARSANKSRAVCARGKRRSCNSTPSITESVMGSIMNQLSSGNELGIEERKVIVWGNITRRRRGQRYPAYNRKTILGRA